MIRLGVARGSYWKRHSIWQLATANRPLWRAGPLFSCRCTRRRLPSRTSGGWWGRFLRLPWPWEVFSATGLGKSTSCHHFSIVDPHNEGYNLFLLQNRNIAIISLTFDILCQFVGEDSVRFLLTKKSVFSAFLIIFTSLIFQKVGTASILYFSCQKSRYSEWEQQGTFRIKLDFFDICSYFSQRCIFYIHPLCLLLCLCSVSHDINNEGRFDSLWDVQGRDRLAVAGGSVGVGARRTPLPQYDNAARVAAVASQKGKVEGRREVYTVIEKTKLSFCCHLLWNLQLFKH